MNESVKSAARPNQSRPFLGVMFECCSVYVRIYKNREGTAYVGHCPKCAKRIAIRIGAGGSDNRFFRAR
jgi:hypothetical protein